MCGGDDAINEDELILCCAFLCANCAVLPSLDCCGCSGKVGICCLQVEYCCKPGAPILPCGCIGPKIENDGCSAVNAQGHCCCTVVSMAFPCNDEVPVAVTALGVTLYPRRGCCLKIADLKKAPEDYEMER